MNWIKSNFWEIARSPLLSHTGALLAVVHLITYFFWLDNVHLFGAASKPLLCWSFWSGCQEAQIFSANLPAMLLTSLLVASCIAIICFLARRLLGLAWFALFYCTAIYTFFYLYDASLATDAGGLFLLLSLGFLFIPNKPLLFRAVMFLFFVVSAYKLWSVDWLSGSTLIDTIAIPPKGLEWVAALTMAAYLILPILLVSPIPQRLAYGFGGLAVVQGFFFFYERSLSSLTLLVLLLFFLFDYFEKKRLERESLYQSYEHPEPSRLWPAIVCLIFLGAQTKFLIGAYGSELIQVHGPAQTAQCRHITFVKAGTQIADISNERPQSLSKSLECHPWVNFNFVRSLCRKYAEQSGFETISHHFLVRQLGEKNFRTLFADKDFCRSDMTFAKAKGAAR